jgi:hypothetical protein
MTLSSKDNRALVDVRDAAFGAPVTVIDMETVIVSQLGYLEESFGYSALNDGLYTEDEINHARAVLSLWMAVYA